MSSYSELVKNFEKVRDYMRQFYVYGFKTRNDYDGKSARTYDDEKRRIESWLGEYMSFVQTPDGKNVFLSIDTKSTSHNPLYKALKAKSFTDKDITLHFILLDILRSDGDEYSLNEIVDIIDSDYLSGFENPITFDESTVRKKLKEYTEQGLIISQKKGKATVYRRTTESCEIPCSDLLHYFSEVSPCGVVGSFLLDKHKNHEDSFFFKHHYITNALDCDVLADIFDAMSRKFTISAVNVSKRTGVPKCVEMVPLKVYISVQSGRQHLMAYVPNVKCISAFRIDYLSDVKLLEKCESFDDYRNELDNISKNVWGVGCKNKELHKVSFTVCVNEGEDYIVKRLEREKRCGNVEKLDEHHYRFSAEVYEVQELVPWMRTFICRITDVSTTDKTIESQFLDDIKRMYSMYLDDGGDTNAV